ncbi:MAG: hypothetical protein AB7J30_12145 [Hyphomicrobium sp.]|uniref:hypothetical protein n=1 Tax=Hyphomicrobium sp. TaxID=82 RepID=UPI003D09F6B8
MSKAAAAIAMLALSADAALSAVRLCEDPVSSGLVDGIDENKARAAALAQWKAKALAHGEGYASWRIAADKLLKCLPKGDGFQCVAQAKPCTIEQAPDRRELRQKRLGI